MKKLFKRILVSTFAIGASLFIGNNVFAENYKVNIAVIGNKKVGKTQIIRCICKDTFEEKSCPSEWTHGAYGKEKYYQFDGDTFECNYYDAPGYLSKPDATIDQQINSKAIKDANIALIVVDPQQTEGLALGYPDSIHEALERHTKNVRAVNLKCKIIVVANKLDTIKPEELEDYKEAMIGAQMLGRRYGIDNIFTSAATGEGISELEDKITTLLRTDKANFSTFAKDFIICQKCGRKWRKDDNVRRGRKGDFYCGEACLRAEEAERCSRSACPNEGRYLRGDEHKGFVSKHTGKFYCSHECYVQEEGTYCDDKYCHNKFVVADGEGFYTNPKYNTRFCETHKKKAAETGCTLL